MLRPRFASLRCGRGWLVVCAAAVLLATLWFGPLAEQSMAERLFAASTLAALVVLAISASGRWMFGVVAGCVPILLLVIAANIKFRYLSTPLLAPDLRYYFNTEIGETLLRYPFILAAIAAALIGVPLLLVGAWRSEPAAVGSRLVRVLRAAGFAVAIAAIAIVMDPSGPFSAVHHRGMWRAMNDRSFISDFLVSIGNTRAHAPAYDAATAQHGDWHDLSVTDPAAPARKPDIVAVLEESTFDPRMLAACTSRLCGVRMFQPDANTIAHGWLDVHTWGGGTWTSEFAFLAGLPHTVFGPAGIYAPFNLAPRIRYTLPRLLHDDGYRTVGIYPTAGDFMNGRDAYADYGFDAFYGGEQLGLGWKSTDAELIRAFQHVFAIEKANAHGGPVFVFMLTLHQHGPHMTPLSELPAPYDRPLFPGKLAPGNRPLDDWLNLNLTNYLQRLSMSDAAMAKLESLLRHEARPALLLHFGDHQPSFDGAINVLAKSTPPAAGNPQFVTYYLLKGFNMPLHREHYPVLDIAYLGSLLLDAADVPRDPFFVANTLLRDRCHGLDLDCRNAALRNSYRAWVFGSLHDLGD